MSSELHLVRMANDIGNFFRGEPQREVAIAGIANHIRKFWTPRMREKLLAQPEHARQELDELPRAALLRLIEQPDATSNEPPGGDAG